MDWNLGMGVYGANLDVITLIVEYLVRQATSGLNFRLKNEPQFNHCCLACDLLWDFGRLDVTCVPDFLPTGLNHFTRNYLV